MPVRPAAAPTFASSSSPDTASAAFVSSASAFSRHAVATSRSAAVHRRARAAEAQQLRSSTTACPSGTPGLMRAKATADPADSSSARPSDALPPESVPLFLTGRTGAVRRSAGLRGLSMGDRSGSTTGLRPCDGIRARAVRPAQSRFPPRIAPFGRWEGGIGPAPVLLCQCQRTPEQQTEQALCLDRRQRDRRLEHRLHPACPRRPPRRRPIHHQQRSPTDLATRAQHIHFYGHYPFDLATRPMATGRSGRQRRWRLQRRKREQRLTLNV